MASPHIHQEFAVIGLGRFGSSLVRTLISRGYSVLAVDRNREIVQRMVDQCTHAVALDSTDEEALREVDIRVYDTVVVAIGANFEANLLTTVALKNIGVRRVICKALTDAQRTILLKVGADRVVLPESDGGRRLALELVAPGVLDQIQLGPNYSVVEIEVPVSLLRRTVSDAALRQRFSLTILAVKRGEEIVISPPANFILEERDLMVVIGSNDNLAQLAEVA